MSEPSNEQHVISFGRGVRLMSEEYYIRELKAFGIDSPRAFRALCRAICCPLVIFGRFAFVDPAVFQICIKHLSMPGQYDFCAPNCYLKNHFGKTRFVNKVRPEAVHRNWKRVVKAIVDSRRIHGLHTPDVDKAAIRTAASELTRFVLTMIPSGQQEQERGTQA